MSADRLNDVDLLGEPRSCRRVSTRTVLPILLLLIVVGAVAVLGKLLA